MTAPGTSRLSRARPGSSLASALATITASMTLVPLFDSAAFLVPVIAVVASITVIGFLVRFLGLPAIVHPVAAALAWLTMLTWIFALPAATWWVLPGPDAIDTLRSLVQAGISEAEVLVPPVPTSPDLVLLAAGGVGIVAIIVDAVGVTLRLPAIAAAPLLVLASLPIAILPNGLPWWLLPIGASGWLVLLAVDARAGILSWGPFASSIRSGPRGTAGPQAHQRPARVLGFDPRIVAAAGAATAIAVVAPLAVPGLGEPVWGTGRGSAIDGGTAASDGPISLDPFVSLRRNLVNNSSQEVVRYTTDNDDPGYLRMVTLTEFDGVTWRSTDPVIRLPLTQPLPPPVREEGTEVSVHSYTLAVGDLTNRQLPVPFAATSVRGDLSDQWAWDPSTRTVSSPDVAAAGSTYTVSAYDIQPTRAQLRTATAPPPAELAAMTDLPGDLSPLVADLARQATAGETSPYRQALALEKWFTVDGGFAYSTSLEAGGGDDPVSAFLIERIGYCEQFAASMALMARSLGIPARVNVGFTSGARNGDGSWSVRGRNAHAWPELWFDGLGWVWFEPTPRSDGADAGVVAPSYSDVPDRSPQVDPDDAAAPIPPPVDVDPGAATTGGAPVPSAWVLIAALVLIAVIAGPAGARWMRRRRLTEAADPGQRIEGAWQELCGTARRFGLTAPQELTPRDYAGWLRQVVAFDEAGRNSLLRLLWWSEQSRYAPNLAAGDTPSPGHLRDALSRVDHSISRSRPRRRRLAAWWNFDHARIGERSAGISADVNAPGRDPLRVDAASGLPDGP